MQSTRNNNKHPKSNDHSYTTSFAVEEDIGDVVGQRLTVRG